MLKLIKHNWIQSYRTYFALYSIFLLMCCVVTPLSGNFEILKEIFSMVTTGMVFVIVVFLIFNIVKLYDNSMFKKSGYLTMTLPVSTHKILLSKIIVAILWSIITSIIIVFGLAFMFSIINGSDLLSIINSGLIFLSDVIKSIFTDINSALLALLMIVSAINSITFLFFLTTSVQTKYTRSHKIIWAIVFYLVFVIVSYFINTVLYGNNYSGLIFDSMYYVDYSYNISQDVTIFFIKSILIQSLYTILFYFSSVYIIDNMLEI